MIKKIIFVLGLVVSASSFAQAEKFSGASIGLNTGFNSETADLNSSGSTAQFGQKNTPFDINLSYTFAVTPSATIGLGLNYDLSSNKVIDGTKNSIVEQTTDIVNKNHYSLNFEPGFALNDSLLGYFKLAYHAGKLSGDTKTYSMKGYGYGFGTRYMLDKNLFLNLEIQSIVYNSITAGNAKINNYSLYSTIGLGYKF